jgi:hypothetical protein
MGMMGPIFDCSNHLGAVGGSLDETIGSNAVLAWTKGERLSAAARTFVELVVKLAN